LVKKGTSKTLVKKKASPALAKSKCVLDTADNLIEEAPSFMRGRSASACLP
jgi:hypothetical protein